MAEITPEGSNPTGPDGVGGASQVNVKKYVTWQVDSTKHIFHAPLDKYKDLASTLGLTNVETKDGAKEKGLKLSGGQGYIKLGVRVKGGGRLHVICDPKKVGEALTIGLAGKVYGQEIDDVYILKRRALI
ncbi:MAG: hypothetical protein QNJ47_23930 [Nostocaceae cyanobacterium]|nr:hypothetical protein [Nostocaceae cyanobacterium]